MKTIYLSNGKAGWEMFGFEHLSDIEEELLKRSIQISPSATIEDQIKVDCMVRIGDNTKIGNFTELGECVIIDDEVEVGALCCISEHTRVGRGVRIKNSAEIGRLSKIGEFTEISSGVKLLDYTSIGASLKIEKVLHIYTTKYEISYWGENAVQIGSTCKTIEFWLSYFEDTVSFRLYTEEDCAELKDIVSSIKDIHKKWKLA